MIKLAGMWSMTFLKWTPCNTTVVIFFHRDGNRIDREVRDSTTFALQYLTDLERTPSSTSRHWKEWSISATYFFSLSWVKGSFRVSPYPSWGAL
jgi:hypothetical protein